MLTSLLTGSPPPQGGLKSFHEDLNWGDSDNAGGFGTFLTGTNFNLNGLSYLNANGTEFNFQFVLNNYTTGQTLTLRMYLCCTVNTGDKTFTGKLAAMTPGVAQSVLTKTYGTSVVSAATVPNATAKGLYTVDLVFDTSAKLNSAVAGDFLDISITQTAHTGTSGTATLLDLEIFN